MTTMLKRTKAIGAVAFTLILCACKDSNQKNGIILPFYPQENEQKSLYHDQTDKTTTKLTAHHQTNDNGPSIILGNTTTNESIVILAPQITNENENENENVIGNEPESQITNSNENVIGNASGITSINEEIPNQLHIDHVEPIQSSLPPSEYNQSELPADRDSQTHYTLNIALPNSEVESDELELLPALNDDLSAFYSITNDKNTDIRSFLEGSAEEEISEIVCLLDNHTICFNAQELPLHLPSNNYHRLDTDDYQQNVNIINAYSLTYLNNSPNIDIPSLPLSSAHIFLVQGFLQEKNILLAVFKGMGLSLHNPNMNNEKTFAFLKLLLHTLYAEFANTLHNKQGLDLSEIINHIKNSSLSHKLSIKANNACELAIVESSLNPFWQNQLSQRMGENQINTLASEYEIVTSKAYETSEDFYLISTDSLDQGEISSLSSEDNLDTSFML